MNRVTKRTWIMGLFLAVLLGGMMFFLWEYVTQAGEWVTFPGSPHVYNNANIGCGTVTDRSGNVLLDITEERTYSSDAATRQSTLHWLGDRKGYISASAVSHYAGKMAGFDLVSGVYDSSGEGGEMTLTLSARVQNAALDAMAGRKGTVGVYNYKTGEILCALTTPTYDPENRPDIENDETGQYDGVFLNKVLSASMTPGSTFKIITCAAAIDNIPDINERVFTCSGEIEVDGEKITCMASHGQIGFEEGMSQSCNIVFAELAMELGKDKMTEEAEKMGFGSSFTIDGVPTLASSYDVSKAETRDLGWSGIGQYTDLVNPMHLNILMGAIANGGVYVTPYYIDSIKTPFGLPTYVGYGTPGERLLKSETADALKDIMRYTVETNYGDSMFPGLTVCAKTGTGEIGEDKNPNGWMTGFTLDSDCPLAFTIVVENSGFGMAQAGPIAQQLLQSAAAIVRGQ